MTRHSDVEVDQSGKVERTQMDTVLAFSNNLRYAIRIPAAVKRAALHALRQRCKPSRSKKAIYVGLFAAGLYLLLREHLDTLDYIIIDVEYPGREADIRGMLLLWIRRIDPEYPSERIVFRQVGKKSPAHNLAWEVYRGKHQADRVITEKELLALL
ncbi:MAG: hypothetical protein WBW48_10180 [Anaerolineae bacterium]